MALLAFGIFLLLLGGFATLTPLATLGWSLLASGAILTVAHVAVGPRRPAGRAR